MSQSGASPASAAGAPVSSSASTRLSEPWRVLARVVWVLLVVGILALFVGSLPTYAALLPQPCTGVGACSLNGALTADALHALQAAGLSANVYANYTIALTLVITLIWTAIGLVIFWRRSDDWMALLAALTLVLYNPGQQGQALAALALTHPIWTTPVNVVTFLSEMPIVFFLLLFPDGRFVPRWTRWLVPLALAQSACLIFLPAVVLNASTWLYVLNGLLFSGFLLIVVFSQVYRYRRISDVVQRQQTKWVVFGIILTAVLLVGLSLFTVIPGVYQPGSVLELVLNTLYPLASLALPLSIGVAVLRYRLWDIDTIINKALVYGLLTSVLGALYAVLIIGLTSLAGHVSDTNSQPLVLVIATLVIAALVRPAHKRIQQFIDRRFYRKRFNAEETLAAFGTRLRQETDLEQLRAEVLSVLGETLQPAHVSLWLRQPERTPTEQALHLKPPAQTPGQPT